MTQMSSWDNICRDFKRENKHWLNNGAAYLYLKKFVKNLITNDSENLGKPHKY